MKFVMIVALFSICNFVSAQDTETLDKVKAHALSNIDQRISFLQELKSCVSGSTTKDAIKQCRTAHQAKIKSLKDSNSSWRQSMKSERQSKRDAKKK